MALITESALKFNGRTMLTIRKGLRRFDDKGRRTVSLTPNAMKVIDDLAERTNTSRSKVLQNAVALYKMALDSRKDSSHSPAMSSLDHG